MNVTVGGIAAVVLVLIIGAVMVSAVAPEAAENIGDDLGNAMYFLGAAFVCLVIGGVLIMFGAASQVKPLIWLGWAFIVAMTVFAMLALKAFWDALSEGKNVLDF